MGTLYTDEQAYTALNTEVNTAVTAAFAQVEPGETFAIYWPRVQQPSLPGDWWARVTYRTVSQDQSTLGECDQPGRRRWTTVKVLLIDIYGPMSDGRGLDSVEKIAGIVQTHFRGIRIDGMILLHPRVSELPEDGHWYRRQFVIEVQYDTSG